ncbi:hypothetical protein EHW61_16505 [Salinivibrio sp. VYel6]|uniref:sulfotransferase domain-containing protein n=1 Tax=Salinivibrio sp. VYel6 TaxID=2490493 RepID=UPI00128E2D14|nr:sulfotransferase domain-containing protein [Salinivibrio sp. VYel6]MPX98228.1 hypothetical protein [Salinivibrio sp. VYel6]
MNSLNILVSGVHFSGSGAVKDLLREYREIYHIPGEFDDFRRAGLVGDHLAGLISQDYPSKIKILTKNLMSSSALYSHVGLKKAIKNKLEYKAIKFGMGAVTRQPPDVIRRIYLLEKLESDFCRYGVSIDLAVDWINNVKKVYSNQSKFFLFDQPIFQGLHSSIWPEVFNPFKLIVVFRDPRDQIVDIINHNHLFKEMLTPTQGTFEVYGSGRLSAIKYHSELIMHRAKNAKKIKNGLGDDRVLFVKFEDLICHEVKVRKEIERFLGISGKTIRCKRRFFDPEKSIKNIGIYKNALTEVQCEALDGCLKFIDEELGFEEKYVG